MKVLYILMRNDLSNMNAGRAMAQASHASNKFIYKHGIVKEVKEWQKETNQGFGTAIVLSADYDEIFNAVVEARKAGLIADKVDDPEYGRQVPNDMLRLLDTKMETAGRVAGPKVTTIYTNELTCGYVFGEKEECQAVLGHLKLHP